MNKFIEWFGRNRKTIGYVVGGVNLGSGAVQVLVGDLVSGISFLILGAAIIFDTVMYK